MDAVDSLGLMQSSADLSINTSTTVTHSFLHFTIQEFLAAYHLSKQPAQVQELFVETHKNDSQFHMLLKFLVGLNSNALPYLGEIVNSNISTTQLHWLFESQSPKAVCKYLGNEEVSYRYGPLESVRSYDLYALTYCLCHSNCKWNLSIDARKLSSIYCANTSCTGEILSIRIIGASCSNLPTFFSLPRHLFQRLFKLEIIFQPGEFDSTTAEVLKSGVIPWHSLNDFAYVCDNLPISATLNSLCDLFPNLTFIGLAASVISLSDMLLLCQYITSTAHSSKLELGLSRNVYFDGCIQNLISAIAVSTSISNLHLNAYHMSLLEMEMLSIALSTNTSLESLELLDCSIDGEAAEVLANGLEENKTLVKVDLRKNKIDARGAAALGSMLAVNTFLKKLNLSDNNAIGIEGAIRLINALEHNKSLVKLAVPAECEPIEYRSDLLKHIREENRISFAL